MAVVTKHFAGSLRLVSDAEETISSYHRIHPNIIGAQVESFLDAVTSLRGESGGNAYLTLSTELLDVTV